MTLLIAGLVLWSVVHFVPSIGISLKRQIIDLFGEKIYLALFAVLIISSLVLIVLGWRSTVPTPVYAAPVINPSFSLVLMVLAFLLFGAAKYETRIKGVIRHPQLTSVIVWATAHLLLNGDSRSVVLFGWMGCWAVLEIFMINRREGKWIKPEPPGWKKEVRGGAISLAIFVVVILLHPYIAGVPVR